MNRLRRWLILPVIAIFVLAVLLYFGKISIETTLPINVIAPVAAAVAGFVLILLIGLEARMAVQNWEMPDPEEPPTSDKVIYPKPLKDAEEVVDRARKFSSRANQKVRIEIDIEDAKED